MRSQLSRLALCGGLFLVLCSVMFIVNQTAQIVSLATAFSPVFGKVALTCLLLAYGVIILVPVIMIARMPAVLRPPVDADSPEYETYLIRLGDRLKNNPYLTASDVRLTDRGGIEAAIKILDKEAEAIIKKTAASVFVSTAISQNGRLDALMVLAAQTRMIWQVARVYNQRPLLREMIRLYSNVGLTLFVASEIEDLDLSEQVEPVIRTALSGSLASLVPGITSVSTIVTQSILEGTANAYLTLRVGTVCRTYCASVFAPDRKSARRYASVTAAAMLGSIVAGSAAKVAKAILSAAKNAGVSAMESTRTGVRQAGARLNPFKPKSE